MKTFDSFQLLIASIVARAFTDYQEAKQILVKRPKDKTALYTIEEVKDFFNSSWFETLSTINPNIEKIKKEIIND